MFRKIGGMFRKREEMFEDQEVVPEQEHLSDQKEVVPNEVMPSEVVSKKKPGPLGKSTKLTAFADLGVEIPEQPLDLSHVLAEEGVTHTYIIVTMGRTGSTWLADAIGQIPAFNHPHEYFSQVEYFGDFSAPQSFENHFRTVVRRYSRNGCFGFKINPRRLSWLSEAIDIEATFPATGCAWIGMKRLNIVKQAFSYARARTSGHWHTVVGRSTAPDEIEAVAEEFVWGNLISILEEEKLFEDLVSSNSLKPMRIAYEEVHDSKDQLMIRIASHIREDVDVRPNIASMKYNIEKLKSTGLDEEADFTNRYSRLINSIMSERDTISPEYVKSQVAYAF